MKKRILLFLSLLGSFTGQLTFATEVNKDASLYWAQFSINKMHCEIYANDILLHNTKWTGKEPVVLSYGHLINEFLLNGRNELKIKATHYKNLDGKERKEAYCGINVIEQNYDGKNKTVAALRVLLNQDNQFILEDIDHDKLKLAYDTTVSGDKNSEFLVAQALTVDDSYNSLLNSATEFLDTPANREKLWLKYEELQQILKNKDIKALKAYFYIANDNQTKGINTFVDKFLLENFEAVYNTFFQSPSYQVLDINKDQFELKSMANNKLVQYTKDTTVTSLSPIQFTYRNLVLHMNAYFGIVDGKIIPVLLHDVINLDELKK